LIKPFYHRDEYKSIDDSFPGGIFAIAETVFIDKENIAAHIAIKALQTGAETIIWKAKGPFNAKLLADLIKKEKGLKVGEFHFVLDFLNEDFIIELATAFKEYRIFLNIDIIGDHEILIRLLRVLPESCHVIGVDTSLYQHAGATMIQQLAYGLAQGNEYLNYLYQLKEEDKIDSKIWLRAVKAFHFTFAVGSDFFFEIAKLQSFRVLWRSLTELYDINFPIKISVKPTLRNKTIYDYNVNLIRTSTECMAGIVGGADTVCNISYDAIFHKSNDFSNRISRNQLVILKEESHIKNGDFFNGTYYLEALRSELSQKALNIFKEIEKGGGFADQIYKGTIQRKIAESNEITLKNFNEGSMALLGSNKFPNPSDKMKDSLDLNPFLPKRRTETEVIPVIPIRISEMYERNRLKEE
jgi:methylmalonyl-CoA mutase